MNRWSLTSFLKLAFSAMSSFCCPHDYVKTPLIRADVCRRHALTVKAGEKDAIIITTTTVKLTLWIMASTLLDNTASYTYKNSNRN